MSAVLVAAGAPPVSAAPDTSEPAGSIAFVSPVPTQGDPGVALSPVPVVQLLSGGTEAVSASPVVLTLTRVGDASGSLTCNADVTNPDASISEVPDGDGRASFAGCKVDKGGSYELVATQGSLSATTPLVISGPAVLAFTTQPGDAEAGLPLAAQPVLRVEDATGAAVAGEPQRVALVLAPGPDSAGAVLSCGASNVVTTDAEGVASFAGCTVDRPGAYALLAYAERDKVAGKSAEFTIDAGDAQALRFATEPVGGAAGGIAVQPVVAVVDAGGNTVAGSTAAVSLSVTGPSSATLTCSATSTVKGRAAFDGCAVSAPGTYTLTATAADLTTATSASFTVIAGGVAAMAFTTQPGGGAGGQAFGTQPVVELSSAGGAPTTGIVTLSLSGGSAGASLHCDSNPAVTVAAAASFSGCQVDAVGEDYVLRATSGGISVASAPFDVTAGQVAALRITAAPETAAGGSAFAAVKVEATDSGGNPAAGSVTLGLVPDLGTDGAVLDCDGPRATTNGLATFTGCAIDLAGAGYRLQATVAGAPAAVDTTEAFDVTVGPAHHLAFRTAPGGGTGGTAWAQQPVVAVEDAGGNRVVGSTAVVDLALSGTSGSLTCSSDPLPVTSGAAVFAGCAVDRVGTYRLSASAGSLVGSSDQFVVAAGPASQLLFSQQPQRGAPGAALSAQPRVTVADAGGNPAAGAVGTVELSLTPGTGVAGAALSCAPAPVSSGVAGFNGCRVATAGGGYTLTAAFNGLRAESLPFNVVPAAPTALGKAPTGVPAEQTFGGRLYANNPTSVQDSVNTATGSLHTSVVDLQVAGVGQDLFLERTYSSADTATGAFGQGWSSVLDLAVTVNAAQTRAVVRGEDGQRVVFTRAKPSSAWTAAPGARASLTCSTKSCTVLRQDGTSFEVAGTQLVSYLDENGQGLRFGYELGQLRQVLVATTDPKAPQVVAVTTAGGRVTSLRTPAGRTVSYAYSAGLLTRVTDVLGKAWVYTHVANRLSRITDPDGAARLAVSYAADGRVASVVEGGSARRADSTFSWALTDGTGTSTRRVATDGGRAAYVDHYLGNVLVRQDLPAAATLRYGYDAQTNLTHVQDPAGWVQVMTYAAAGDLLSQSSPLGNGASAVVRMTYDALHRTVSRTDANGQLLTYVYNGPNLGSVRPPGVGEGATRLTYDNLGLLLSVTTPVGRQVFTNDAYGNQVRTVDQDLAGLPLTGPGTTSTYDEAGRRTSFRSALGIVSTWSLDAAGRTLAATTPGGTVTNTYSPAGVPLTSTSSGATTRYSWDEASLTRRATSPAGTTVQVYDGSGNVLRETAPNGLVTEHAYDGLGREVVTTTGSSSTRHTFDDASNVVLAVDSDGAVLRQQFDALNRPVRLVSDGLETRTSYDAEGNVTATRDESGAITTRTYDGHGNPSTVSDGSGTTSYRYDLADNVVGRTDGRGGVTTWTYDAMSRATSMSVADRRTTYAHDLDSRVVRTTDPEGRTTTLTLDAAGNPLLTAYRGAGYAPVDVRQSFDGQGRRTSLDGVPVTYDDRGNKTAEAGFRYDYATAGTVVETYPNGKRVTYQVDGAGNLMAVRAGSPGEVGFVEASYVRDGKRRATGLALSNGVLQTRAFDAAGNVLDQTVRHGGTALAHDAYTWDARGNRLSQRTSALGVTAESGYAYEASGRLAGAATTLKTGLAAEVLPVGLPAADGGPSGDAVGLPAPAELPVPVPGAPVAAPVADLRYDAVGNRTSADGRTWTHGPTDEVVTDSSGTVWTYDRSGAVTGRSGGGQSAVTYAYDAAARLTAVTTGGQTVRYGYDGDGNRTSRSGDGATTTYAWSPFGSLPQLAVETTGGATTNYVHGEGPIAAQTGADVLFFHLDPLGSTNAVTDAAGALVASFRYSAYGDVVASGTRSGDVDLLFHAQQLDRFSGLYNMRARQYDPQMGRFTQREPAATPVGLPVVSAYAFVGNQPTGKTDPTGRTVSTATVFAGQTTEEANAANNAKLATKGAAISLKVATKAPAIAIKVATKFFGYTAAVTSASSSGVQLAKAAEKAKVLKGVGIGLAVVGIALQTYVTIENCMNGPVEKCVASATGLALNIGFTVGCSFITSGAGSFACAMIGATLSIGLEYVIGEYGPEIVAGLIDGYEIAAPWVSDAAELTAAAFVDFGNDVAQATTDAVGVLVVAVEDALAAVESGYADALAVLTDAGLGAVQLAELIADTFDLTARETVASLVSLGYSIADAAVVLEDVFVTGYEDAAVLFVDGFAVATTEVAAALEGAYDLTAQELTGALADAGVAVTEIAVALEAVTDLTAQGIAELLDEAEYVAVAVGAALQDALDLSTVEIVKVLADLDYGVQEVAGVLRDVGNELGAAAAVTLKAAEVFLVVDVAEALSGVYAQTAAAAAAALEAAGYLVADVALGLQEAYDASALAVTQLLKDVDFTSAQIAGALVAVYEQAAADATLLLHDVGFGVLQVADALEVTFTQTAAQAAALLAEVGYSFTEVGEALDTTFDQTAAASAQLLEDLGATATQTALVLQVAFGQSAAQMALVLAGIGADVQATALALQTVYGQVAADAAQALESAGYAFAEVGAALAGVFDQTAAETAALLNQIGADAQAVIDVLGAEFSVVGTDVLNGILLGAGYVESAISEIGGAFEDFGNDVADFFSSIF